VTDPREGFRNVYEDPTRAEAYARLEFPGTYFLAFRDLPALLAKHVRGTRALDFGCGAGRSTRFLKRHGFDAVGIDVSASMTDLAQKADPEGTYLTVPDGDYTALGSRRFDVILSAFAFDNIPGREHRAALLRALKALLAPGGRIVLLASTPAIYTHEWASFTTRAFPENRQAQGGDEVKIVMKDVPDARPVVDLVWSDEDHQDLFRAARLRLVEEQRPLGRAEDGQAWISETHVAPWVLYVLGDLTLAPDRPRMHNKG
jgi:SAM-dependent methyltransferase